VVAGNIAAQARDHSLRAKPRSAYALVSVGADGALASPRPEAQRTAEAARSLVHRQGEAHASPRALQLNYVA